MSLGNIKTKTYLYRLLQGSVGMIALLADCLENYVWEERM
jgi:hypothetical protein